VIGADPVPFVYASRSWRLVGQIAADCFVVVWTIGWAIAGSLVHAAVSAAAEPVRQTAATLWRLSASFQTAADDAASIPGVGRQLRRPFDDAVVQLGGLMRAADQQVLAIERAATALGWATFVIPVLIVLLAWLPRRVRFVRRTRAAQRLVDAHVELDFFALRALTSRPVDQLVRISDDPLRAWRTGDRSVIDALARLELRSCGLRLPPTPPGEPIPRPQHETGSR
jgi:hypothetical protein